MEHEQQAGYRETELDWLPEEWEVVKLGDVADVIMGQSPPGKTYNQLNTGMPFLQGKAEFGSTHPKYIKSTTMPIKIAKKGSVLLSVRAPVGDVNIANIDYCIGRGLSAISLNNGDNLFLFHLLTYHKTEIEKEGTGSTFKAINKSKLLNLTIPLPPLPEQRKIAAVLAAIQDARDRTEQVIAALKEFKKSLMKHLFTYGSVRVDEVNQVRLKETEIGMMPEGWDVVKIGYVAKFQGGYAFKSQDYSQSGIRLFRISNVSFGKVLWKDVAYLPEIYSEKYKEYILNPGDLVMAMTRPIVSGGIKITRLKDQDCPSLLNQRVGRFILKSGVDTEFLFQILFNDSFVKSIGFGALGSQQPNISATQIENILIPLPLLPVQHQIAAILSAVDEKIEKEENTKNALNSLFQSMLHELMTAKLRVNDLEV